MRLYKNIIQNMEKLIKEINTKKIMARTKIKGTSFQKSGHKYQNMIEFLSVYLVMMFT